MELFIQDPLDEAGETLLDVISRCSSDAISGAGSFAWATTAGLKLLLEDANFARLLKKGPFELVVGVDAITTPKTLSALTQYTGELPQLLARAFYHTQKSLFHPKFCFFRGVSGGVLITGSGNLTSAGLQSNWEAFSVSRLNAEQLIAVESVWNDWKDRQESCFLAIDTPAVIERAALNRGWEQRVRAPRQPATTEEAPTARSIVTLTGGEEVLIAEIPRAGNRWKQANFKKKHYEEFFGARVGGLQTTIVLQHVRDDGSLGQPEARPSVEVSSSNFRFELDAAGGKPYPASGRPIGIYLSKDRRFLYALLLPGDSGYRTVATFLAVINESSNATQLRAGRTDVESLIDVWPDAPLWIAAEFSTS